MIMERVEGDVYDVDELAHVIQDDAESAWILAARGDEALGCGVGRPSSIAGSLYAMARVLPEHRGQGFGTRLYEALSEHAAQLGLTSLWGRIQEGDAASLRFAENRGFREVSREYEVVLDVGGRRGRGRPPGRRRSREPRRAAGARAPGLRGRRRGRRRCTEPRGGLRADDLRALARDVPRGARGAAGRLHRRARRRRGRRLHRPPAARIGLTDGRQHAHRGPPPLAQARDRNGAQARADLEGPRGRRRADLHDERRDERRHARRQRAPRLPPGADAHSRQRPARRGRDRPSRCQRSGSARSRPASPRP